MLGETTLGTWVAYGALVLLLVLMVVMVLRVLGWLSLLFIEPVAEIMEKIPGLRRLLPSRAPKTETARGDDLPGGH